MTYMIDVALPSTIALGFPTNTKQMPCFCTTKNKRWRTARGGCTVAVAVSVSARAHLATGVGSSITVVNAIAGQRQLLGEELAMMVYDANSQILLGRYLTYARQLVLISGWNALYWRAASGAGKLTAMHLVQHFVLLCLWGIDRPKSQVISVTQLDSIF